MAVPYVVVVGASAGGMSALTTLMQHLPADLPAAVAIVLHVAPHFDSQLPSILSKAGALPVTHARNGDALRAGHVLVAPPDHHLLIRAHHVELSHGPRENHARPAVDPSLRTAARAHGKGVAGVVMSGTLGDGTMGLMAVKAHGGVTIVQDPQEASYSGMPEHALRFADVDHVLPVAGIARSITHYANAYRKTGEVVAMEDPYERVERRIESDFTRQIDGARGHGESIYTCPDCGGVLWQNDDAAVPGFRCYQGHSYAAEGLLQSKSEALENALWSATRALVERATLNRQLALQMRKRGLEERARQLDEQADSDESHLRMLRRSLLHDDDGLLPAAHDAPSPATQGQALAHEGDGHGDGEGG